MGESQFADNEADEIGGSSSEESGHGEDPADEHEGSDDEGFAGFGEGE